MLRQLCTLLIVSNFVCAPILYAQEYAPIVSGVNAPQYNTQNSGNYTAGESVPVTLYARDSGGNLIQDWDQTGSPATVTLYNSDANTDTSMQSWNDDPDGYSWAMFLHDGQPLTQLSANEWTIPPSIFTGGVAELEFVHTKALGNVYYEITPVQSPLNQVSGNMSFAAGATENFLVDLTSSRPDKPAVYHMRKYEVTVVPRDQFLNPTNDVVFTKFSARFPGEFLNSQPGYSGLFGGAMYLQGATNYFLASSTKREAGTDQLQWIMAYAENDPSIVGKSADYEVLTHAPAPFDLFFPFDNVHILLVSSYVQAEFDWERSNDEYSGIVVSNTTGETATDIVHYTVHFIDSLSMTREFIVDSDDLGLKNKWTTTHGQLRGIVDSQGGYPFYHKMIWFVEATDGLYITRNIDPRPAFNQIGNRLAIEYRAPHSVESVSSSPSSFRLHQNYPNPFNPTTTIRFEIIERGYVTLKVYDLVGNEVATLANETLDPGVYSAEFNASGLASGVYHYTLTAGNNSVTKSMVVEK